jgi:GNAT superfamily N-acetyltransferase
MSEQAHDSQPIIRRRISDDMADCVEILRAVHLRDSYPVNWPVDAEGWLEELEAAWVAEIDGHVVGHVAARITEGDPSEVTVERLFVAPSANGLGLGAQLLAVASAYGDASIAVLAVADNGRHAQRLYRDQGWSLRSRTPIDWGGAAASSLLWYELRRTPADPLPR